MENQPSKKSFWKTPLGILVAIFFFPFFLTYWVYKQNWNPKVKWGLIIGFWLLVVISGASNSAQQQRAVTKQAGTASAAQPTSEVATKPVQNISPSPVVTYPPFDKNRGNNYVAAKYAQQFMDVADKAAAGAVQDIYLELSPEDPKGKTEDAYKQSISSAFLTVVVDPSFWNTTDDSSKKDLVAAYTTAVKNNFSGFPHIKISNGIRTVAEGEWSVFGGEAKVTLK